MVNDVFYTVLDCQSCAKARGTLTKSQKNFQFFPANGPFKFVAMDILGPLPKTKSGERFIVFITDSYSKLTSAMPMNDTTALLVAACFLNNWVFLYGIPNSILTYNLPQFIAQFFRYVCAILGI